MQHAYALWIVSSFGRVLLAKNNGDTLAYGERQSLGRKSDKSADFIVLFWED